MPWSKLSVLPHRLSAGKKGEREREVRRGKVKDKGVKATWISSSGDWNIW